MKIIKNHWAGLLLGFCLFCGMTYTATAQVPLKRPTRTPSKSQKERPAPSVQKERQTASYVLKVTGSVAAHDYVDLGLSVKWATCNLGADCPEEVGTDLKWGNQDGQLKVETQGGIPVWKFVGWGNAWRLPTLAEIQELVEGCSFQWTTYKGTSGYVAKSRKNGNRIFIPAGGLRQDGELKDVGRYGGYWSSANYENDADYAYGFFFDSKDFNWGWDDKGISHHVRPVCE